MVQSGQVCYFSNYPSHIIRTLNFSLITPIVVVVDLLPFCSSDAQLANKSVNVTLREKKNTFISYLVWMRSSAITETERNTPSDVGVSLN